MALALLGSFGSNESFNFLMPPGRLLGLLALLIIFLAHLEGLLQEEDGNE